MQVRNSMKNKGFTLLEFTIVMSLIAIMTGLLWASFNSFKSNIESNPPTYYTDIVPPDIVDYASILKSYGIDISNLTDEDIKRLVEELKKTSE